MLLCDLSLQSPLLLKERLGINGCIYHPLLYKIRIPKLILHCNDAHTRTISKVFISWVKRIRIDFIEGFARI